MKIERAILSGRTLHLRHPAPLASSMEQRAHRGVACRCLFDHRFLSFANSQQPARNPEPQPSTFAIIRPPTKVRISRMPAAPFTSTESLKCSVGIFRSHNRPIKRAQNKRFATRKAGSVLKVPEMTNPA